MSEDVPQSASGGPPRRPGVGAIASLLAASVLLSRLLGYLRDVALADRVGAGAEADAYYAAFQIPDLLNYLLAGGALAIAFIPLYTRIRDSRGEAAAERLFANILGTIGSVSLVATVALWVYAEALIALQFPHFDAATSALTVRLTRIVLPAQVFFLTGGIARAVLMAHGRFGAQALAPLVYNAVVIAGGLATGTPEGFAWGVLVGSFLGPFALAFGDLLRRQEMRLRVRVAFDRDLRAYLWIALPLMLGLSLATVDEWYERWFGGLLETGTVAHLAYARKLMMAPVAVVGQAVGAALLPTLSRLHAAGKGGEFNATLDRTLQASLALGVLAAGVSWALAGPLVELVYLHGRFVESDARAVAAILGVLSVGVPGWVCQQVGARAFYARGDTWRPMLLGTVFALAAIPVYLAWGREYGALGLAAAGVVAMSANAMATLAWARRRYGAPHGQSLVAAGFRALVVTGVGLAAIRLGLPELSPPSGALAQILLSGMVYTAVVGGLAWVFGGPVLRGILGGRVGRLRGLGSGQRSP